MTFRSLFKRREIPTETRFLVLERDAYSCVYCKTKVSFYTARFAPVSAGGRTFPPAVSTLRTCCRECDAEKGDRDDNVFWFERIIRNLKTVAAASPL